MSRKNNTDCRGNNFNARLVQAVWAKGIRVPEKNPDLTRKDACGDLIERHEYGNGNSPQGWHVDHKKPVILEGGDELSNLQPLQWRNNLVKGDSYPNWKCSR